MKLPRDTRVGLNRQKTGRCIAKEPLSNSLIRSRCRRQAVMPYSWDPLGGDQVAHVFELHFLSGEGRAIHPRTGQQRRWSTYQESVSNRGEQYDRAMDVAVDDDGCVVGP